MQGERCSLEESDLMMGFYVQSKKYFEKNFLPLLLQRKSQRRDELPLSCSPKHSQKSATRLISPRAIQLLVFSPTNQAYVKESTTVRKFMKENTPNKARVDFTLREKRNFGESFSKFDANEKAGTLIVALFMARIYTVYI